MAQERASDKKLSRFQAIYFQFPVKLNYTNLSKLHYKLKQTVLSSFISSSFSQTTQIQSQEFTWPTSQVLLLKDIKQTFMTSPSVIGVMTREFGTLSPLANRDLLTPSLLPIGWSGGRDAKPPSTPPPFTSTDCFFSRILSLSRKQNSSNYDL